MNDFTAAFLTAISLIGRFDIHLREIVFVSLGSEFDCERLRLLQ